MKVCNLSVLWQKPFEAAAIAKLMKQILIILTLLTNVCIGQEIVIDSCGIDNSITLNQYEVDYFNQILEKQINRADFDFQNKKVGFAYGIFGKVLITKKEYFDRWGKEYFLNDSQVANQLILFTKEEKNESGGYDAIIVSWSKTGVYGKHKENLIKKLK
ncbi:MAG: hypothetical protein RJQ00_13970 [Vicingaceae bacterium]